MRETLDSASLALVVFPYGITGGSWIILAVLVAMPFVISSFWWTRRGSAINHHPYHGLYDGQAGAWAPCRVGKDITCDVRNWTRGTR